MRANIPKKNTLEEQPTNDRPAMELQGVYLRAMQDISARLMEALPADEALWHTLTKTEALLIEAQLAEIPLQKVFEHGGVAGFCQSIVDEYNQERKGQARDVPAAHDPSLRRRHRIPEPKGGINYYRKRRATVALIAAFSLLLVVLAVWYTGLLNYWVKGSSYYLDELYHFSNTVSAASDEPIQITLPLSSAAGLNHILYADAAGNTLTLTELSYAEHLQKISDSSTEAAEDAVYQKNLIWRVHIRYPVDVGYMKVRYIEPSSSGTAVLTLPTGETMQAKVSAYNSGSAGRGYEYTMLEVLDIPASMDTEGAVLTITLDPPRAVEWRRVSMGWR